MSVRAVVTRTFPRRVSSREPIGTWRAPASGAKGRPGSAIVTVPDSGWTLASFPRAGAGRPVVTTLSRSSTSGPDRNSARIWSVLSDDSAAMNSACVGGRPAPSFVHCVLVRRGTL